MFLQRLVAHALSEAGALLAGAMTAEAWLESAPDNTCPPIPLGVAAELPTDDTGWLEALNTLTERLLDHMRSSIAEDKIRQLVLNALDAVSSQHGGPDASSVARDMVPPWALEDPQAGEPPNGATEQAIGKIALVQVPAQSARSDDSSSE